MRGLLPFSQESATGLYPESHTPLLFVC